MGKPLLAIFLVGVFTLAMFGAAVKAEKGEPEEKFRGRRAGVAMLISHLGRNLGKTGSLALGGVAELICVGWLVAAVKSRGSEVQEAE
ncbi:hypothetical protein Pan44_25230 [Caulifigura coniformis]|uniref:Uncharacterized protein n=1 Tax=Caulifigura coniformis TaxID=2527983 RepID=A0A517SED3_9PLAN|nr:hypothetical protein [Caulifigura coniformis]QDT54490.1 hypothetical protein Pan44_25230 [Caulifigura coniformis]